MVFGDIGTSPLYAFRECFSPHHGVPIDPRNLTGAASLIVWSLLLVVSAKYLFVILRLDNRGEGGILALSALIRGAVKNAGGKDPRKILLLWARRGRADLCGWHPDSRRYRCSARWRGSR